ncbi:hypothetical protein COT75_04795 [Candidatus Beckwithbacteria bacterium CG10_big_fil_rev_8_21_14_0_10_34_10]|uniref:Uncharacterized protein n=1 Tax=Candidatus Beckwithbacteria bacterium CG10_big_fil_rev_8_21_14_0_10_34_10 TaxID=1974495 RepID=A0A2H0W7Y4_9BACT|nr:MAG: hypothetical protein COT75_04795 [Candidatus Beckwithbacteria bacterium CG10_big_fil_rev_8_21_14_0_10_34_10]
MKRLGGKTLIFLSYFLAAFILRKIRFFSLSYEFIEASLFEFIFWFSGIFLGVHFLKFDQFFHAYFTQPDKPLSLEVKALVQQKKIGQAWDLLSLREGEQKLAFRSFFFQIAWVGLAIFTLTSTSSLFGKTLLMAIGLRLLLEEWEDILQKKDISWLFWQIGKPVSLKEQKKYLYLMTIVFSFLSLLLA